MGLGLVGIVSHDGSGDTPVLFLFLGARRANGSGDAPVLFLFLGARRADGSGDTPVLFLFLGLSSGPPGPPGLLKYRISG